MPRKLIYLAAIALFALHHDGWLWDDAPKWVDVEYVQARSKTGEEAYTEVEVV